MIAGIFGSAPNAVTKTVYHQTTFTSPKKNLEVITINLRGDVFMGWDYSSLSHLAKQNGGPAELLAKHAAYHFKKGAASKNPKIAVASLISLGIGAGGTALYIKWKNSKNKLIVTENEVKEIEEELISGMEQVDKVETTHDLAKEDDSQYQPPVNNNYNEDLDVSN